MTSSIGRDGSLVLTGDFNTLPDYEGLGLIRKHLRDAELASISPPLGGDITFNGFGKDLQPGNKIDLFLSATTWKYAPTE